MQPPSDAFTLKIRQGPQQAKVATPKDKDRKPIDPPPILQLHVRDPCDPANNYLQSPHYFMCANLQNADTDGPPKPIKQDALGGQICSSLHRLKDVDNHDGGFFVFSDLHVKVEGQYRLCFSLFEMCLMDVKYIKSIISDPFNVYSTKEFPGMSASTFLSRSFGDQGVKLRIRKEPRTMIKRQFAAVDRRGGYDTPSYSQAAHQEPMTTGPIQADYDQAHYARAPEYHSPSAKRQRSSISYPGREAHEYGSVYGPVSTFPPQHHHPSSVAQSYATVPAPVPSSYLDYSYSHHARTNSSATSSPYVSPLESSGYPSVPGQHLQQHQQARESYYTYCQPSPAELHYNQVPQLAYPAPPARQDRFSNPLKIENAPRIEAPVATSQSTAGALTPLPQSQVYQSMPRPQGVEEAAELSNGAPPPPPDHLTLPPLHSTLNASNSQGTAPQLLSSSVLPRIDFAGHGSGTITRQGNPSEHPQTLERQASSVPTTS